MPDLGDPAFLYRRIEATPTNVVGRQAIGCDLKAVGERGMHERAQVHELADIDREGSFSPAAASASTMRNTPTRLP